MTAEVAGSRQAGLSLRAGSGAAAVMLCTCLVALDSTIIAPAAPSVVADLALDRGTGLRLTRPGPIRECLPYKSASYAARCRSSVSGLSGFEENA